MHRIHRQLLSLAAIGLCLVSGRAPAAATDDPLFAIKAAEGRFEPAELVVPAATAFKVRVTNAEAAPIEFESFELHRERVVQPGDTITVNMPSLAPGTYKFFDDFHSDTPAGAIIVK